MEHSELKTLWKVARGFWISAILIWIVNTVTFLIYEGWHYKATNPIEVYIGRLSDYNFTVAIFFDYLRLRLFYNKFK